MKGVTPLLGNVTTKRAPLPPVPELPPPAPPPPVMVRDTAGQPATTHWLPESREEPTLAPVSAGGGGVREAEKELLGGMEAVREAVAERLGVAAAEGEED